MAIPHYSGQLHPKRKTELLEIAASLNIPTTTLSIKLELEEAIREKLMADPAAREDSRWKGLWASMGTRRKLGLRGTMTEAEEITDSSDDSSSSEESDAGAPRRVGTFSSPGGSTSSLVKRVPGVPNDVGRNTTGKFVSLSSARKPRAPKQIQDVAPVKSLMRSRSSQNLIAAAKAAEEVVTITQQKMNDGWIITGFGVGLELLFLAFAAVPWNQTTFGPHKWLTRSPTPAFTLPVPALSVLLHPTFVHPLRHWTFTTIVLPLLLALLFAFPRYSSTRAKKIARIAPPNAVVFNVGRVTVSILVNYIFKTKTKATVWNFDQVEGYPAVQVLGAAVAAVLAVYEESLGR